MRTSWAGLVVDVIDYELLRFGEDGSMPPLGDFRDVHLSPGSPWRLVAGYLMAEAGAGGDELTLYSHGRPSAQIALTNDAVTVRAVGGGDWAPSVTGLRANGLGLVVRGTVSQPPAAPATIRVDRDAPWSLTVVHGPASSKIEARARLLESWERTGGRRG